MKITPSTIDNVDDKPTMQTNPSTEKNGFSAVGTVALFAEYNDGAVTDRCQKLADRCQLDIVSSCTPDQLLLTWIDDALTLCQGDQFRLKTRVDFASGKSLHRLQYGGGLGQPLARAAKITGASKPFICDATGGLGRDAFVFASLGCKVVILEQSPVVFALLADGLRRALLDPEIEHLARLLSVHNIDCKSLPESWPHSRFPDTVYLDPMYPHDRKKTAAKKEMQLLQRLHLDESNEAKLLQSAIGTARQRVAVKRPLKALPLAGSPPSGSIKSTNTRYDIYPGSALVSSQD